MNFDSYDTIIANKDKLLEGTREIPTLVGEVQIILFRIVSPIFPKAIDVSLIFTELVLQESITSSHIEGYINLVDAIGLIELMPIVGDEYFELAYRSKGAENLVHKVFRIKSITNYKRLDTDRAYSYTLNLCSEEYLTNLTIRVQKGYKSKLISDIVDDIWQNYIVDNHRVKGQHINSSYPPISIEKTQYAQNFVIPNLTPFESLQFLASRAISSVGFSKGAWYVFYETMRDGFKFVSLESLMQLNSTFSYKFAPLNLSYPSDIDKLIEESRTVTDFRLVSAIDASNNIKSGLYSSRLITHDIVRMRYEMHDFHYIEKDTKKRSYDPNTGAEIIQDNIPNTTVPVNIFGNIPSEKDVVRTLHHDDTYHIGLNPIVSKSSEFLGNPESSVSLFPTTKSHDTFFMDANNKGVNRDRGAKPNGTEDWLLQRKFQKRLLSNYIWQIDVPGNSHRSVGDKIRFEMPMTLAEENTKSNVASYSRLDGFYLVTKSTNIFKKDDANVSHKMTLDIATDGFGVELPEIQKPSRQVSYRNTSGVPLSTEDVYT